MPSAGFPQWRRARRIDIIDLQDGCPAFLPMQTVASGGALRDAMVQLV